MKESILTNIEIHSHHDTSINQPCFREYKIDANGKIECAYKTQEYNRVYGLLKDIEEKRFDEMIKQANQVLKKKGYNEVKLNSKDIKLGDKGHLDEREFERAIRIIQQPLFEDPNSNDILLELKPVFEKFNKKDVFGKLFRCYCDFHKGYADGLYSVEVFNKMTSEKTMEDLSDMNSKRKKIIKYTPTAEKIIIKIKDGDIKSIIIKTINKKNLEMSQFIEKRFIQTDLLRSELQSIFENVIDVEMSFSYGVHYEKLKEVIIKTLESLSSEMSKIQGTNSKNKDKKPKNNYEHKFFKRFNLLYRYLMDNDIIIEPKAQKSDATMDFIIDFLKIENIKEDKLNSYRGRTAKK